MMRRALFETFPLKSFRNGLDSKIDSTECAAVAEGRFKLLQNTESEDEQNELL